ncbi:hypothetical protein CNECB9_1010005 [Cupriavidus necator]|uniref:Uncharacterized protein n=1 Tax=Cupriavidus necator TaxID=106590 RepID=A0A1K0JDA5_CUPNE|nr:hypothetical protein CNECB9_1010005 [Cupriavidus necator]
MPIPKLDLDGRVVGPGVLKGGEKGLLLGVVQTLVFEDKTPHLQPKLLIGFRPTADCVGRQPVADRLCERLFAGPSVAMTVLSSAPKAEPPSGLPKAMPRTGAVAHTAAVQSKVLMGHLTSRRS